MSVHNVLNAMLTFAMMILKILHVQQAVSENQLRLQHQQPLRPLRPHLQPRPPLVQIGLLAILTPIHIGFAAGLGLMVGQVHAPLNSVILMSMKMIISMIQTPMTIIMKIFHANLQSQFNAILISSILGVMTANGTREMITVTWAMMVCWISASLLTKDLRPHCNAHNAAVAPMVRSICMIEKILEARSVATSRRPQRRLQRRPKRIKIYHLW